MKGKPLSEIQREMRSFLGEATYRELHRENLLLDVLAVALPLSSFFAIIAVIGRPGVSGPWKVGLVLLQGWLMTIMGLVNHDVFVHRRRWGGLMGWFLSALLFGVLTIRTTAYGVVHLRHHGKVGTDDDPEVYKQDVDTVAKRWLFATILGFKLGTSGKWSKSGAAYMRFRPPSREIRWRLKAEVVLVLVMLALFAAYAYFVSWQAVVLGYLAPMFLVVPLLNSIRIIIEHADIEPENPYSLATNYRTGWFTQALFLADSGDCHLVHHLYPRVPYYRVRAALRAMQPFFKQKKLAQRTSYPKLLGGWFVKGYAHRTAWPQ